MLLIEVNEIRYGMCFIEPSYVLLFQFKFSRCNSLHKHMHDAIKTSLDASHNFAKFTAWKLKCQGVIFG